mmetsp:Transcript_25658/g.42930  ORF Transcript_25658/g.42930 Transcript_25658/m.42930 type:complete len:207 (+) Transcript_25658:547-1167(+)
MVVVPALTERKDPYPPVVPRQVTSVVGLLSPHVASRVHKPGDVVHPADAERVGPGESSPTTNGKGGKPRRQHVQAICLLQPHVERLLLHIRGVGAWVHAGVRGRVVQEPAHVAVVEAFVRGVRIAGGVTVQMVVPVGADPLERISLDSENAAVSENVFQPLGRLEGLVRELAVVRKRDAKHTSNNPADQKCVEVSPGEAEGGGGSD